MGYWGYVDQLILLGKVNGDKAVSGLAVAFDSF